jgi:hypothetical protein
MTRLKKLSDLQVHEVSLVNRAANLKRFLITKAEQEGLNAMPTTESIRDTLLAVPAPLMAQVEAICKSADGMDDEATAACKAAMRILQPHMDRIPKKALHESLKAIMPESDAAVTDDDAAPDTTTAMQTGTNKSADTDDGDAADEEADEEAADKSVNAPGPDEDGEEEMADKAMPDFIKAKIKAKDDKDAKEKDKDAKKKALAKSQGVQAPASLRYAEDQVAGQERAADHTHEESNVAKSASLDLSSFTPEQRAAIAPIFKSQAAQADAHQALLAEHKEAIAKSQALQHKLDRQEFVAKAKAFPHLGKADELGEKMHDLHDASPELAEKWFDVLKSANLAAGNSDLFQERGSRMSGTTAASASKIDQAVAGMVTKSVGGMTHAQAVRKFLSTDEGKKMYNEERAEADRARRNR